MRSGFKLFWSDRALGDLKAIIAYLADNWTEKEIQKFSRRLEKRLLVIADNPRLFPKTNRKRHIRRSVLSKHIVIYYKAERSMVTILTLFDPRQDPYRLQL
jgi:plasmid stabilization system protein ParE